MTKPKTAAKSATAEKASNKTPNKTDAVIALMQRKNGASLEEMVKATGWLPHTTHAALSGLRKKGHAITRAKQNGTSRYSIESGKA